MSTRKALGLAGIALCVVLLLPVGSAQADDSRCEAAFDAFETSINELNQCMVWTPETGCNDEWLAYHDAYREVTECWFDD